MNKQKEQEAFLPEPHGLENRNPEDKCGIGLFQPKFLQFCANIKAFVGLYSPASLITGSLITYLASQITTLEKQFKFTSTETGFLFSCNDIGYLVTILFVSYFARNSHIPRVLFLSTFVFSLGGVLCALPHFVTPKPSLTNVLLDNSTSGRNKNNVILCMTGNETASDCTDNGNTDVGSSNRVVFVIIMIGMMLQGLSKAPRHPLTAVYIDNNDKKINTGAYMGILTGTSIFGPALAFSLGGLFSSIYVTLEPTNISPHDPRWIGAWWLGYLTFGAAGLIFSIPLVFFPKHIQRKNVQEIKESQSLRKMLPDMMKSFGRLFLNPIYISMNISGCLNFFSIAGIISFLPKYLETQFLIPTWKVNIIFGASLALSASFGSIIGGFLTSKLKLGPFTCLKYLLLFNMICIGLNVLQFAFGCSQPDIIKNQVSRNRSTSGLVFDNAGCSDYCLCKDDDFLPTCGSDGKNYFSPCYAGCSDYQSNTSEFSNCSCVAGGKANPSFCDNICDFVYPYVFITSLKNFLSTLVAIPGFIVLIRSISDEDKSLGLAFSAFLASLFGWLPGPVAYGHVVDWACQIWKSSCDGQTFCALYDNKKLRIGIHSLTLILKIASFLFILFGWWKGIHKTDWSTADTVGKETSNRTSEKIPLSDRHEVQVTQTVPSNSQ